VPDIATNVFPPFCFGRSFFGRQFFWPEIPSSNAMSAPLRPEPHIVAPEAHEVRESLAGSRLRKHADFQQVYAGGKKRRSASMSWFMAPQSQPAGPRVGLTVGKVLGKAHERNRIKRRLREVLRRHVDMLPAGCDLVLHPHRSVLTMEFSKLDAEIVRILTQANAEHAHAATDSLPHAGKAEPAS
jgi:ribonuclease P protein component